MSSESLLLFILCPLKVYCCSSCVLCKSTVVHLVSSESLLLFILCPLKVYCCSSCILWNSWLTNMFKTYFNCSPFFFNLHDRIKSQELKKVNLNQNLFFMQTWLWAYARFTTVLLKALSNQVLIRYQYFCFFKLFIFIAVSLQQWFAQSLFIRSSGEPHRNKHSLRQKNDGIFHNFDPIKDLIVPL